MPFCKVWVCESEYKKYTEVNDKEKIVSCAKGIQGNLCRIRNHILKTEFSNGADVVLIVDDDMSGIFYFEKNKTHKVQTNEFLAFVEKHSILAKDINAKLWGCNIAQDRQFYREYSPFSTTSYIGGPFQAFLSGNACYYDESLPLKEDYDMTLQQLNKYRVVLRMNKFFYRVKQSKQAGGCATYRNFNREMEQLFLLQKKWGSAIVKVDKSCRSHNLKKTKKKPDYNPIIKPPIKGR